MPDKPASVTVGQGPCTLCATPGAIKANKKNHLYIYCATPAEGGCGGGFTSRYNKSDELLAQTMITWAKSEYRAAYLGEPTGDPAPAPAPPKPVAEPVPEPPPEPAAPSKPEREKDPLWE